jgi:hypothetical protein
MPGISAWLGLAADTVTIEPYASQNKNGEPTYSAAATYRAHIQGKVQRITDLAGDERISSVQVYLIGQVTLSPRDRLTLPARFTVTQPKILAIGQHAAQTAAHHTVIYT